jgi:hypothetical protein
MVDKIKNALINFDILKEKMPNVDFVSVIGFDIVGSADPRIPGQKQEERKKAFRDCLYN